MEVVKYQNEDIDEKFLLKLLIYDLAYMAQNKIETIAEVNLLDEFPWKQF